MRFLPVTNTLYRTALAGILILAAGLRFWKLNALGYANHYYSAAVASMLKSWLNFFYLAAEPGGSVSVDKPPVGFWLQAASARVFGVNSFGLLLPQALAGVLAVWVLYRLVRRSFGPGTGLLAALGLAVTPVAVAADRNNTIDSLLVLVLLLAAWAFIQAAQAGRLRYLLLGAVLVGIGFNIKMLQAYLPLPAFLALYFFSARQPFWRKVGSLALAGVVVLAVSFSWALIVDLTPAGQRPYVGGSSDNREISLITGYNGLQRLLGRMGRGRDDGRAAPPATGANRPLPAAAPAAGPGGMAPRGSGLGQRGILRLLQVPLSKEAGWLLPLALLGAGLLLAGAPPRWPAVAQHQAVILWGGWLTTAGIFFSAAEFFHEYYLTMLAAPTAALAAIGIAKLWDLRHRRAWLSNFLLLVAVGGTICFQVRTAEAFVERMPWLVWIWALLGLGAALLFLNAWRKRSWAAAMGFTCTTIALLITPGVWSALTAANTPANNPLPGAYNGQPTSLAGRGGVRLDPRLLNYLQTHTQDIYYLLAVPSSMVGADFVIATGRPVLYTGGFNGSDPVASAQDLQALVAQGRLRYVLWSNNGIGMPGRSSVMGQGANGNTISGWLASACAPVPHFNGLYACGE